MKVYEDDDAWFVIDEGWDMTVASLLEFCQARGIDPKKAEVSGAYGEPTELRWPKETE
jgi:hypothetical protein